MGYTVGPAKARFLTMKEQLGMIRKCCDEIENGTDIERQVGLVRVYCGEIEKALAVFWSNE